MLKGRLLRQKAINLEGDQKMGKIGEVIKADHVGNEACTDSAGAHKASSKNKETRKKTLRKDTDEAERATISPETLDFNKNSKRTTFSKRIHSSPLFLSKPDSAKAKLRTKTKSADEIVNESHKLSRKESPVFKSSESRTLEEVVQEFLLYFHDKRRGIKDSFQKTGSREECSVTETSLKTGSNKIFKDSKRFEEKVITSQRSVGINKNSLEGKTTYVY